MSNRNKHGLSRNIPENIRRLIRKNSGYGCVVCGNAIVEYEHVDPEFCNARNHNALNMTLLCPTCHSKVTKKIYSKDKIKQHMENPWAFQHGLSYTDLELPPRDPQIHIGNSFYQTNKVLLRVRGKNLFQFHTPESANSPYRVSAEFYNQDGQIISKIKENIFKSILGVHDVSFTGSKITIKSPNQIKPSLVIITEGGEHMRIEELNMFYNGVSINLTKEGSLQINAGNSILQINQCTFSGGNAIFDVNI